ncbi:MAG: phosphoadenosine phosphosulfate reductase family protein [Rhizobiaceae bacterium]|nr:phosphoadenosine phosphosulfate reductase family protein [Rhizobiaceae bacterium]
MDATTAQNSTIESPALLNMMARTNAAFDVLGLALRRSQKPIVSTKFGPQSAVLLHLATRLKPDIDVVWVDTGFNSAETHAYVDRLRNELELNLHIYRPTSHCSGNVPTSETGKLGHFARKVKLEPFKRALSNLNPDVWITALRREQTQFRSTLSLFQINEQSNLKVCPLIDWNDHDMETYMMLHELPVGPEVNDPTKVDAHLECGLHNRL